MDTVKVNYRQYKAIKQFAMMNHVMEQFEDIFYTMEEQDIFPLLMKPMERILQAMYEDPWPATSRSATWSASPV